MGREESRDGERKGKEQSYSSLGRERGSSKRDQDLSTTIREFLDRRRLAEIALDGRYGFVFCDAGFELRGCARVNCDFVAGGEGFGYEEGARGTRRAEDQEVFEHFLFLVLFLVLVWVSGVAFLHCCVS